jgi:hypothetical protein
MESKGNLKIQGRFVTEISRLAGTLFFPACLIESVSTQNEQHESAANGVREESSSGSGFSAQPGQHRAKKVPALSA